MRFNINDTVEIAQIYLGNLTEDSSLSQRIKLVSPAEYLETYLSQEDCAKGRIKARSTSGIALGIIKGRDWSLRSQDVFQTDAGKLLLIHLQQQKLMVLSFAQSSIATPVELVKLGHVLGNQHYPLEITAGKIYLQASNFALAEKTIQELQIPGLEINYEMRSPEKVVNLPHHHH